VLEYEDFRFLPSTLMLGSAPLAVGKSVQIAERDAKAHDYHVISVRQVSDAFAAPRESA